MSEEPTRLEIEAPSVAEAIEQGAQALNVTPDDLDYEVLEAPAKGLFGVGGRPARVRLTLRPGTPVPPAPAPAARAAPADAAPRSAPDEDEALQVAGDTVRELLQRMGVRAEVTAAWGPAPEAGELRPLLVDIHGNDLSILIGRKGETLSALQYITRLIVGKELGSPTAVVVDVEGYRGRRERQLRQLARRMADQAVEAGRTMTLEPMPANERRIVHIELRDRDDVATESVGEGDQRKVTIAPRT